MSQEIRDPQKCAICHRPAFSYNFGVLCCDACKMFFRRTMAQNVTFTCPRDQKCMENLNTSKCRACRIKKCLEVGMSINSSILEIRQNNFLGSLISSLISLDTTRERVFLTRWSDDDPNIEEVVMNRNSRLVPKDPNRNMEIVDWCFVNALTGIRFLLNLEFMKDLGTNDKVSLIRQFRVKCVLMFTAFRSFLVGRDVMTTPEGDCVYPEELITLFSEQSFQRLRCQPVARFIELQISKEEFLLLLVLFFSYPCGVSGLSENAQMVLSTYQSRYCSALLQWCQLNHQQNAPSRLTDLLSLCHVISRSEMDVKYLLVACKIFKPDCSYRKLVIEEE